MIASTIPKEAAYEAGVPEHVDVFELQYQKLKADVHQQLVESLDLSRLHKVDRRQLQAHIAALADEICSSRRDLLSSLDRERLLEELPDELFGLGPLEKLMRDPEVSDILVNDPYHVYVERRGRLEATDLIFADAAHLMRIIQRVAARLGRRVDETSPMVDARLPDGSRVNAVVPPLALDGPSLSIRRFGQVPLGIEDLLANGTLLPEMHEFLAAAVESRLSVLVAGGTGAGKTTLLNGLSSYIPKEERIVTIEDSAELILRHPHRVRLETRPPNTEGRGEITQRDLVRNSLRMRPDRIIVGEVRGGEVWDMLQAMNTGHDGSLTTVHANNAFDALSRLEMMVFMTGFELPVAVVRQYIASGIDLVVHLSRLKGGVRRVMQVSEIVGVEQHAIELRDVFTYEQTGVSQTGVAEGQYCVLGYQPQCLAHLQASGLTFADGFFQPRKIADTLR